MKDFRSEFKFTGVVLAMRSLIFMMGPFYMWTKKGVKFVMAYK